VKYQNTKFKPGRGIPKRSLSQNFLTDPNIVRKICDAAKIVPGEKVLEIGPGKGALTHLLLERGAHLLAIEKDDALAQDLIAMNHPHLTVVPGDALEVDLPTEPYKVVANLPYHITSPILARLCHHSAHLTSALLMVQKEVADRLIAAKTNSLSLFIQFYASVTRCFIVSRNCFYPRPKVDSAIIRLDFRPTPDIDPKIFFPLMRKSFQQKRKQIATTLGKPFRDGLSALGIRPDARPEDLNLNQWVSLVKQVGNPIVEVSPHLV